MKGELNNIRLSDTMMVGLYGKSLVQENGNPPAVRHSVQDPKPPYSKGEGQSPEIEKEIRFLGNNARHITIFVHNTEHIFLPEDQLSFLTKILGACKLNIGDVAIVNTANYHDAEEIINSLHPAKIISFATGINTENIPCIIAPSIKELIIETPEAKTMKAKLWNELKQMFSV